MSVVEPEEMGVVETMTNSNMDVLWALAVITAFGDLVTTRVGLQAGFHEGNQLIVVLLDAVGWAGFTLFKLGILIGALLFAAKLNVDKRPAVPLGLASTWAGVTMLNALRLTSLYTPL